MDSDQLRGLLEQVYSGAVDVDAALDRIRHLPFEDLGYAKLDHHRLLRHGLTEVIFGKGKTPEQIGAIATTGQGKEKRYVVKRPIPGRARTWVVALAEKPLKDIVRRRATTPNPVS